MYPHAPEHTTASRRWASGLAPWRVGKAVLAAAILSAGGAPAALAQALPPPYRDSIPGTLVWFDMIPVPGGRVVLAAPEGSREVEVRPFWLGRTELTWDAYDVWAFALDAARRDPAGGADAVARPSRPYGAPDRGFGHRGYPAIGITYEAAAAFCAWLSRRTGKHYRLPTDAEWTHAARLGLEGGTWLSAEQLEARAWHAGNAGGTSHPVGARRADALGLSDMLGNVAEWVTGAGGRPVVRGGSWADPPEQVGPDARAVQAPAWNESDPQLPKSRWWLSDAPFVGFRIVREP